jgi:hypothetical protein
MGAALGASRWHRRRRCASTHRLLRRAAGAGAPARAAARARRLRGPARRGLRRPARGGATGASPRGDARRWARRARPPGADDVVSQAVAAAALIIDRFVREVAVTVARDRRRAGAASTVGEVEASRCPGRPVAPSVDRGDGGTDGGGASPDERGGGVDGAGGAGGCGERADASETRPPVARTDAGAGRGDGGGSEWEVPSRPRRPARGEATGVSGHQETRPLSRAPMPWLGGRRRWEASGRCRLGRGGRRGARRRERADTRRRGHCRAHRRRGWAGRRRWEASGRCRLGRGGRRGARRRERADTRRRGHCRAHRRRAGRGDAGGKPAGGAVSALRPARGEATAA